MTTFYFEPQNGMVSVKIKSDVPINAWQGSIVLPPGVNVTNILTSGSVGDIWQRTPVVRAGEIVWSGGKTNGFSGDGVLFQFIWSGKGGELTFQNALAYANDGQGTEIKADTEKITLSLSGQNTFSDTIPPDPFTLTEFHDSKDFGGEPVIIFEAHDSGSGISRYEARETTSHGILDWHAAQSPYLVNADVRKIEIKAIDSFGNSRVESIRIYPPFFWPIVFIIIAGISLAIMYNRRKR